MKRRSIICLLGAMFVWPSAAFTQVSDRRPLVAVLIGGSSTNVSVREVQNGLVQAMQEHGYVEGRDIDIVYRYADGDLKRMPVLVINLKTAKALGLMVPPTLLARADELIE